MDGNLLRETPELTLANWDTGMIDLLVKCCPLIAGILYAIVGIGYFIKKDYPWSLVWISYALANLGLVLAASAKENM